MSFEESLIRNAAPTLAGIKVANLYNFCFADRRACDITLDLINQRMNPKGVYIELLKNKGDFYLIYVYRKTLLQKELADSDVRSFLKEQGYEASLGLESVLSRLKEEINKEDCFPHEIGVFLGYPLPDVKAFIANKGRGCLACGEWKVYYNEQAAMCLFCKLNHCKEVYRRVYGMGRSIEEMTVSA